MDDICEFRVVKILESFPLKTKKIDIYNQSLCDVIDLFGSIARERIIAVLFREFGEFDTSKIDLQTKIFDLVDIIRESSSSDQIIDYGFSPESSSQVHKLSNKEFNYPTQILSDSFLHNHSIGMDIQFIKDLPDDIFSLENAPFRIRVFSVFECLYAKLKPCPLETLAGFWAAKEAIKKLNSDFILLDFSDINIFFSPDCKPLVFIKNQSFENKISLSISHSNEYSAAVAFMF